MFRGRLPFSRDGACQFLKAKFVVLVVAAAVAMFGGGFSCGEEKKYPKATKRKSTTLSVVVLRYSLLTGHLLGCRFRFLLVVLCLSVMNTTRRLIGGRFQEPLSFEGKENVVRIQRLFFYFSNEDGKKATCA